MVLLILFHRYRTPRQRLAIICADSPAPAFSRARPGRRFDFTRAPDQWILGFLGLVPLAIGCHLLTHQESMATPANRVSANHLFLTVTFITGRLLWCRQPGGLHPLLRHPHLPRTGNRACHLCRHGRRLLPLGHHHHPPTGRPGTPGPRYGTLLAGVIYLGLGILILSENGTALHLWHLIHH